MLLMFIRSKRTDLSACNTFETRSYKTSYRAELNADNIFPVLTIQQIFKGRLNRTAAPEIRNLHFGGGAIEKRIPEYDQPHTQTQPIDSV